MPTWSRDCARPDGRADAARVLASDRRRLFQSPAVEDVAPQPDCVIRTLGRDAPLGSEIRTLGPRYEKTLLETARSPTPATQVPRLRREGPRVRIRLPPAESPSLSRSCFRGSRTPAFRAAVRLGDRVGRDAQAVSRSRQPAPAPHINRVGRSMGAAGASGSGHAYRASSHPGRVARRNLTATLSQVGSRTGAPV
jgi:hypothetical protein